MPLEIGVVVTGPVAEITLSGELDGSSAPHFQQELESLSAAAITAPTQLVLHLRGLTFLASAGVRVLFFARQRLFPRVLVYVVAPQEQTLDTLRRTGADKDVVVLDTYPPP